MQANSLGGSEGSSRTEERIAYLSKELGIGHCPTGSPGGNVDNSVTGMPYKKRRGLVGTALFLPSADGLQSITKLIIHIKHKNSYKSCDTRWRFKCVIVVHYSFYQHFKIFCSLSMYGTDCDCKHRRLLPGSMRYSQSIHETAKERNFWSMVVVTISIGRQWSRSSSRPPSRDGEAQSEPHNTLD